MVKKFFLLFSLLLLSAACAGPKSSPEDAYSSPLMVGDKRIFVAIAKTLEQKKQGLSGREKLKDGQGMLFDFSNADGARPGFWMKEMKFDLDLIWIRNGKIIGITADVPRPESPADRLPLYYPPSDVDYVLEVNASWAEKNKIKVGDKTYLK